MSYDSGQRQKRVDLGGKSLVRYTKHGKRLEIVVDPKKAWLYKQGEDIPIDDIVDAYIVFTNFSKGEKAGATELANILGTEDDVEAVKKILDEGDLLITQEQRKEFLKKKRQEVIDFIHAYCVNPRTKAPHPKNRIEAAMDQAGVNLNYREPAKEQALRVINKLKTVLPLQMETATVEFRVPPTLSGQFYGLLTNSGEVVKEEWGNDGSLSITLQLPGGIMAELMDQIASKSKGKIQTKVVKRTSL